MEIDFYLHVNLELFISSCTVHWPLCCPIRSYYSEAVSEKVMVNDVKHDSDEPDINAQLTTVHVKVFLQSHYSHDLEMSGERKLN